VLRAGAGAAERGPARRPDAHALPHDGPGRSRLAPDLGGLVRALRSAPFMTRAGSWKDLWLGSVVLALAGAGAAAVLAFARVGALRGDTVRLYAVTPHARGILPGSEVWLAGRKVGLVRSVGFRPPSTDTSLRVILALDVLADAGRRSDAPPPWPSAPEEASSARPSSRSRPAPARRPPSRRATRSSPTPATELESIATRLTTTLGTEVPLVLDNIRVPRRAAAHGACTLGALASRGPGESARPPRPPRPSPVGSTAATARSGFALGGGRPHRSALAVLERVDQLKERMASATGHGWGRLRTDKARPSAVRAVRSEPCRGGRRCSPSRAATAGRASRTAPCSSSSRAARAEAGTLILADVARNPLRYVRP
jgi:hypothetical protein